LKEFIENTLHQKIRLEKYGTPEKLPLNLQVSYELYELGISGQHCLLAEPKENVGLAGLRKQQKRMEILTGMYCVLYLTHLNAYSKEKMLTEGIPFVLENSQVYMPFLGIWLNTKENRALMPCNQISFLTQKMLLMALYNSWDKVTVTKAAEYLQVAKMSITRCFDEIESLEISGLGKKGKTRYLSCLKDKKQQWEEWKLFMRDPVLEEFYLAEDISGDLVKSGFSALSEYSMLEDNSYPTCAIMKSQMKEYAIRSRQQTPKGETVGCIVQELGYQILYKDGRTIDPLTTLLIMERGKEDPRVDMALDRMLEEYVW
jgi:hypothetical protein